MARILIVEDEPSLRRSETRILSMSGHEVRAVASGAEALASLDGFVPDLILADWLLGEETGYEVTLAVRERYPDVRALFITGYPQERIRQQARQVSPWPVLEKPVDVDVLIAAIDEALRSLPNRPSP